MKILILIKTLNNHRKGLSLQGAALLQGVALYVKWKKELEGISQNYTSVEAILM